MKRNSIERQGEPVEKIDEEEPSQGFLTKKVRNGSGLDAVLRA